MQSSDRRAEQRRRAVKTRRSHFRERRYFSRGQNDHRHLPAAFSMPCKTRGILSGPMARTSRRGFRPREASETMSDTIIRNFKLGDRENADAPDVLPLGQEQALQSAGAAFHALSSRCMCLLVCPPLAVALPRDLLAVGGPPPITLYLLFSVDLGRPLSPMFRPPPLRPFRHSSSALALSIL